MTVNLLHEYKSKIKSFISNYTDYYRDYSIIVVLFGQRENKAEHITVLLRFNKRIHEQTFIYFPPEYLMM
jgi:hypothetical protein